MKRFDAALLSVVCLALGMNVAAAQDKYPSKPVKIIVPYAPGGATDIVARVLGEQLRQITSQPFIVENKPGAFGIIAIEEMARSKPDGYTLMIGNVTTNAITPVVVAKKLTINYEKDVIAVTNLVEVPAFVVAAKDFPPKTLAELINYAKKNPGKVRVGNVGIGSYPHYDAEILAKRAGVEMIAIPNKAGASGMLKDLATGDAQIGFVNVASSGALIRAGQVRPLVLVNSKRLPDYPDVPTMAEAGYPGVGTMAWNALFAPGATPKDVVDTLHKAVLQALDSTAVKEALSKQSFSIVPSKSPQEAQAWLKGEIAAWTKIASEVKVDLTE